MVKAKNTNKNKAKAKDRAKNFNYKKIVTRSFLIAFVSIIFLVVYAAYDLPRIEDAVNETRKPSVTIIAENGDTITSFGQVYSEFVDVKELPYYLPQAIMATEDRRFYKHFGFDIIGFSRAMLVNLRHMRYVQGGSTITQQVAKNVFLTQKKTIKRKLQELLLAFWLEHKFTKDEILTIYLNRVYLGSGTYGVEAASQRYFSKTSRDLTLTQAAVIAGLLKAPSKYSPANNLELARKRSSIVLDNMVRAGFITEERAEMAKKSPIMPAKNYRVDGADYFAYWAYAQIEQYIGDVNDDINVYTTLNPTIQKAAENALTSTMKWAGEKYNVNQGAIVVLDKHGAVKALVGGLDYDKSQFNRAVQAVRQAGSAFKPFVYVTALQNGYHKDTMVEDRKITINNWSPKNHDNKYLGVISLEKALVRSVNTVPPAIMQNIGVSKVIKNARKMGISTELRELPSLALGSEGVKPIDMATAYSTFANGGYSTWAYGIEQIVNRDGYAVYERMPNEPERIFEPETITEMNQMMKSVIESEMGTGKKARMPFEVAGKTGTSQDSRDAWFVGYSSEFVCAVWLGNDDYSPMKNVYGGTLPAHIWKLVMSAANSTLDAPTANLP